MKNRYYLIVVLLAIFFIGGCAAHQNVVLNGTEKIGDKKYTYKFTENKRGLWLGSKNSKLHSEAHATRVMANAKANLLMAFAKNPEKFKGFNLVNSLIVDSNDQTVNKITKGGKKKRSERTYKEIRLGHLKK